MDPEYPLETGTAEQLRPESGVILLMQGEANAIDNLLILQNSFVLDKTESELLD